LARPKRSFPAEESRADPPTTPVLTPAQRTELGRRCDDDDLNPDDAVPREQVKAEALARWGQ